MQRTRNSLGAWTHEWSGTAIEVRLAQVVYEQPVLHTVQPLLAQHRRAQYRTSRSRPCRSHSAMVTELSTDQPPAGTHPADR